MLLIALFWCRVDGVEVVYKVTFPAGGVACIALCQRSCRTRAILKPGRTDYYWRLRNTLYEKGGSMCQDWASGASLGESSSIYC